MACATTTSSKPWVADCLNKSGDKVCSDKHSIRWSTKDPLRNAMMAAADRRKGRRLRTRPPKNVNNYRRLWYKLSHLLANKIKSLHSRWGDDASSAGDATTVTENGKQAGTVAIDASNLCGAHAREAAKYHPENLLLPSSSKSTKDRYRSHQPLGPQSCVLISGILSPLGLHLAIALFWQCGVVNFLG